MELLEAIRIVRNQWKIVLPLLAVALIAAIAMTAQIDTSYQTSGTVTLLNSSQDSTTNPYLQFDQSLQTTAQVLGDTLMSDDRKATYEEKGLSTNYTVEVPYDPTRTTLLPMLQVTVIADSPEVADSTRTQILQDIQDELSAKQTQAGAPVQTWIQAFPHENKEIVPVSGSKSRTFVIVFGLGAALALVSAFVVDGFKKGVRNTRRGSTIVLDAPMSETATNSKTSSIGNKIKKAASSPTRTRKVRSSDKVEAEKEISLSE